ncbi:MAG: M48 family metalloprotease [Planctomycetes bacterium]|nr:M48 family metalloprotease [Planctomycetota bacterium]
MAYVAEIVLSNLLVASALALLAALAGLWGRRPALTHALWLLVMLKLITPPLFRCSIPWPEAPSPAQNEVAQAKPVVTNTKPITKQEKPIAAPLVHPPAPDEAPPPVLPAELQKQKAPPPQADPPPLVLAPVVPAPPANVQAPAQPVEQAAEASTGWPWQEGLLCVWMFGSIVWLSVASWRLWRFQKVLRFAEPGPPCVQTQARSIASRLGVRCPDILLIPGNLSPMLWVLGRTPRLLLPSGLLERLSTHQLATLLAHELAHWRRRDDRVRWLELVVLCLYWWCPLAWWARRELHQAEEECCDAWVVSLFPESAKDYALALVETVDFLSAAPAALPVLASGLGRVRLLKRRLTMILQGKTPRALTFTGLLAVAGVGLLLMPLVFGRSQDVQVAAQQPGQNPNRRNDGQPKKGQPRRDQGPGPADVQKLQQAIQARQQELQQRMQELQQMMQTLHKLQGGPQPGGQAGLGGGPRGPGGKGGPGAGPQPGGFPGGPGGGGRSGGGGGQPPRPGGGFGGQPGGPGGQPGRPGGFGGGGFGGGNLEQRIGAVEHKLDMILQILQQMRGGQRGPGGQPPGKNFERKGPPRNQPQDRERNDGNFERPQQPQPPGQPRPPFQPRED